MRCIPLFIGLTLGMTGGSLGIARAASFWFRPDAIVIRSASPVPATPTTGSGETDDATPPTTDEPQDDAGGPPPMTDHGPETELPPGMGTHEEIEND